MQVNDPRKLQCAINVTPLVDVVLVLLIIFMVIAPQLKSGPDVKLPTTDQPPKKPDDAEQVVVAIDHVGTIWIGNEQVVPGQFSERIREFADGKVVIKGDARLTFGEVRQAMLAVEAAGFGDVGLIAERREATGSEG